MEFIKFMFYFTGMVFFSVGIGTLSRASRLIDKMEKKVKLDGEG
jgi:hypothetical protein